MHKIYNKRENVRLSDNFRLHEFDCKCKYKDCTYTIINTQVIAALEELRCRTGEPIIITSGFRCQLHNAAVGGVDNSFHKRGQAVDILLPTGWSMTDYTEQAGKAGFSLMIPYDEQDFIHCQMATGPDTQKFLSEVS